LATKSAYFVADADTNHEVGDVICVVDFHDLCPRHVRDFVGNLSRTLSQSRRNGIWVLLREGFISMDEFEEACRLLGQHTASVIPREHVIAMARNMDLNKDGQQQ